MSEEELLKLFEQNWFKRPIFKKDLSEETRVEHGESESEEQVEESVKNNPVSFLGERAMSDDTMMMMKSNKTSLFNSSSENLFLSPRSVLTVKESPMKLQTILSGKEVRDFSTNSESDESKQRKIKQSNVIRTKTRRGKSMSDLEYEEIKGFMDLGFVFSEEDHKDSNLVSILPGLQRLVKKDDDEVTEQVGNRAAAARPYLSEVWEHCGGRKGKKFITPEIKWNIPAPATAMNEVVLKDHLKLWAHVVASTIR